MNQKTVAIKTPTNWQILDLQQSWRWAQTDRLDSSIYMCYIGYLYVKKWNWIPLIIIHIFNQFQVEKGSNVKGNTTQFFEENRGECIYNFRVGKYFLNKKKYKSQRKILNSILKLRTFVHQKFHTIKCRASQKLSKDWYPEYTTPTNKEKSRKQCLEKEERLKYAQDRKTPKCEWAHEKMSTL